MRIFFTYLLLAALSAGVVADIGEKRPPVLITELGDVPWKPTTGPKVIYGTDDRLDLYQVTDPQQLAWAAASCALVRSNRITNNGNGTYTLNPTNYRVSGLPACPDEPFGDQPVAAFCSGGWLGGDLALSAGHCISSGDMGAVYFVFGFNMQDANTPNLTLDASRVYVATQIVRRELNNTTGADYSVVRLDREVNMPGVFPLEIRRTGDVAPGTPIGVIGHPAGLPQKVAFGPTTAVRSNTQATYFVANLDTYGGNSGSPVFNPATGQMEGILVRGAPDYVLDNENNCFRSNVLPDDGGSGEDVVKTTLFADIVPIPETGQGKVLLDRAAYSCGMAVVVTVIDTDLAGDGSVEVEISTDDGDLETLVLLEDTQEPGTFSGTILLVTGVTEAGNGTLDSGNASTLTVAYLDADFGGDGAALVEAHATVDCAPPVILDARVSSLASGQAVFYIETNKETTAAVSFGGACNNLDTVVGSAGLSAIHQLSSGCISPNTTYHYEITVQDAAGNEAVLPVTRASRFTTPSGVSDYSTQWYADGGFNLNSKSLTFSPTENGMAYAVCVGTVGAYPTNPTGGVVLPLGDDDSATIELTENAPALLFYGVPYREFHVNSNGNITFGTVDPQTWQVSDTAHFSLSRMSPLFHDWNPAIGGTVSALELEDRVAVTFDQVRPFGLSSLNSFQAELFFDGRIRFSYVSITAQTGLVGLSRGAGLPCDFANSDLATAGNCPTEGTTSGAATTLPDGTDKPHSADTNGDWRIKLTELLRTIQLYNMGEFSCDPTTEDGYTTSPGDRTCAPHSGDYAPQDWRFDLTELLRMVQFYQHFQYKLDMLTEDGFAPDTGADCPPF